MPKPSDLDSEFKIPHEIRVMLERDLTLGEAVELHRKNWGFKYAEYFDHEAAHLVLGLCGIDSYQGSMDTEMFTFYTEGAFSKYGVKSAIDPDLQSPQHDAAVFIKHASADTDRYAGGVNLRRTIYWLVQQETGYSRDAMTGIGFHYDDPFLDLESGEVRAVLDRCAIKVNSIPVDNITNRRWTITHGSPPHQRVYDFDARTPDTRHLPHGSNGVEDFQYFDERTPIQLMMVHDRIRPVLSWLSDFLKHPEHRDTDLQSVKIRDLARQLPEYGPILEKLEAAPPQVAHNTRR